MGKELGGKMKLNRETILELGQIIQEQFGVRLKGKELEKLAYLLVGYFDLLLKIENRNKFGNSSHRAIDTYKDSVLDKKEVK